jgi:hypothetical protein
MRAAKQGAFDRLCGLYAVVNALDLIGVTGPKSAFHQQVFDRLTCALDPEDLHHTFAHGMGLAELSRASRSTFRWLARTYGLRLSVSTPAAAATAATMLDFIDWFDRTSRDGRSAVVLNVVMPWLDHWTVAVRRDGRRLIVRDSGSLRSLDLSRFQLRGGAYRIRADQTLLIRRSSGTGPMDVRKLRPIAVRRDEISPASNLPEAPPA